MTPLRWLRSARGAVRPAVLVSGGVAASAVAVAIAIAVPGGGGVTCNQTITTRAALSAALTTTASSGQTICVTANITGAAITTSTDMTSQARVIAQPSNMTVDMVPLDLTGASKITVEGFEFSSLTSTDGFTLGPATADIHIYKNYCHDILGGSCVFINTQGSTAVTNFEFSGNRTFRISCSAAGNTGTCGSGAGYGIYCCGSGGGVSGATITYNTFEGGGDTATLVKSADNAEVGNLHSFTIANNVFRSIRGIETTDPGWGGSDTRNPHADTLLLWAGSGPGTIQNNRFENGTDVGITGDSTDLVIQNNLIVRQTDQACIDANYTHQPLRWTFRQNTVWACSSAGFNMNGTAGGGSNVADRNLVQDLSNCTAAAWTDSDRSSLLGGAKTCWPGASNQASFTPSFANTTTNDDPSYYIPSNLPLGYETTGYTYVAAGHGSYPG